MVESRNALAGRIKHIITHPLPKTARLGVLGLLAVIVALAALAAAVAVILTLAIRNQGQLVEDIIKLALAGLGGTGIGYGVRSWRSER